MLKRNSVTKGMLWKKYCDMRFHCDGYEDNIFLNAMLCSLVDAYRTRGKSIL